ncbi:MAG: hypothetical protein JWQ43_4152 [Glaciihabitans sp.]|nr:hypothetical protein [Glaciihabitans sp.]
MTDSNLDGTPYHDPALERKLSTTDAGAAETDDDGDAGEESPVASVAEGEPTFTSDDPVAEDLDLEDESSTSTD